MSTPELLLRLYVAGLSASSQHALLGLARLRELSGANCEVEIIDVLTNPARAEEAKILATPTLSCEYGGTSRRVIGDLSDTTKVIEFLGLPKKDEAT